MSSFLDLPKAELHVHLEGSIRPRTLLELAGRRGVRLPADDVEGLRKWFEFKDFEHFVQVYLKCSECLREPEDFQLLVLDFMEEQARQNILYSEAHFTVGTHLMRGCAGRELRDALWESAREGEKRFGVTVRWIPDIVRNVPYRWADETLEWALEGREHGVVALGLSGYEATHPNEPFRSHFRAARKADLPRVVHAGEHAGPDSIWSSLEVCEPDRLGHGVRAIEDRELVEWLARRRIPLEICPTSNLCLGVYPDLERHPFRRLDETGCLVTINSDDPPLFNTTLSREYGRVAEGFGYPRSEMSRFARTAIEVGFLPPEERREILERWELRESCKAENVGVGGAKCP
ncbi:MAG: adenosine deaminase [Thermoanaerobaculia bacterium]|nr:adenosine deaminase [Thermoanaerobaculia bacterium]